jgi:DNA-binding MarR family transcriptional regulator
MQLLSDATIKAQPAQASHCAKQLIETVPLVMQFMRRQMRRASKQVLSIPQLRTLYFVSIHERASLSDAADFIGLSLPAMSRLVDALVKKELLSRNACQNDRRHIRLCITEGGEAALDIAWQGAHARLSDELGAMTAEQRSAISVSMDILRTTFDPETIKD